MATEYHVRCGFLPSSWNEVNSTFGATWADVYATGANWADLSAGPVPDRDVERVRFQRSIGDLFGRLAAGTAQVRLDNRNKQYSPDSNQNVGVGRVLSVKAKTDAGSWYSLFQGKVDRIRHGPGIGDRTLLLDAVDRVGDLRERTVTQSIAADVPVGSLFRRVFDAVGLSPAEAIVDTIEDLAGFAALSDITAGEAIQRLVEAGAHFVYVDGRNRIHVRNRNFDVVPTNVRTVSEFLGLQWTETDDRILNDVRVSGEPRRARTTVATVGWLQGAVKASSGSPATFAIDFVDPDTLERNTPVQSIVSPVESSDWLVTADEQGSGSNISSAATLTFRAFATRAEVEVAWAGTETEVFVTKFQVRGFPLQRQPNVAAAAEDAASQAIHGRREFEIETDLLPQPNPVAFSQAYADFLVSRYGSPLPAISFGRKNEEPELLEVDLSSFLTVVETHAGISSRHLVTAVEHDVTWARGVEHRVSYDVVLNEDKDFLILDKDPEGKLDVRKLGF